MTDMLTLRRRAEDLTRQVAATMGWPDRLRADALANLDRATDAEIIAAVSMLSAKLKTVRPP